jgi:C1A family cysteine protease
MITSWYNVTMSDWGYRVELVARGPFSVAFYVYSDFSSMWSGLDPAYTGSRCDIVYYHRSGGNVGGHAVTLVGFGYKTNYVSHSSYTGYLGPKTGWLKYWLLQNSWGNGWNCNGMYKHLRGQNDSNIEGWAATAVRAKVTDNIR